MKITGIPFFVVLFIATFITSCETHDSDDINQQRIRTSYYLSYDADEDETMAYATFRFDNSYLDLEGAAKVYFDDVELERDRFLGIITYYEIFASLVPSGVFRYIDAEESEYLNNAVMANPIGLPTKLEISASEGGTISWTGSSLQNDEEITLFISNDSTNVSFSTEAINATSVRIRAGEIPSSLTGMVEMYITREKNHALQQRTEEGGSIETSYKSETHTYQIQN